jgi:hypothetical protein
MERHATSTIRTLVLYAAALVLLLGAPGALSAGQLNGDTTPKLSGTALVKELQKGGYVIYFRHGLVIDTGEKEVVTEADLQDCSRQRALSEAGQAQTKEIGAAVKALRIPVGEVYAGPLCRVLDTARNIFGKATTLRALHHFNHLLPAERPNATAKLLDMLATVPPKGANTGVVATAANIQEAIGLWAKPQGVAHVFKPVGDGTFTYVGVMQPDAWMAEAKRSGDGGQASGGWMDWLKGR